MNPSPQSEPYPNTKGNPPGARSTAAAEAGGLGTEIDLGLVRRMAAGDEQALSAFYGRWFPIVNALITRMLKSADDVEDVVEETFWQAWRQANRFAADRGSVQTWVLTIARSRALDRLRAARRLREDSIDDSTRSIRRAATATRCRRAIDKRSVSRRRTFGATPARRRGAERAAAGTATGARARIFRRTESNRDRRTHRSTARHHQDANASRDAQVARSPVVAARGHAMTRELTHDEAFDDAGRGRARRTRRRRARRGARACRGMRDLSRGVGNASRDGVAASLCRARRQLGGKSRANSFASHGSRRRGRARARSRSAPAACVVAEFVRVGPDAWPRRWLASRRVARGRGERAVLHHRCVVTRTRRAIDRIFATRCKPSLARGQSARTSSDSLRTVVALRDSMIAGLIGRDVAVVSLTSSGAKAPFARMFWDTTRNTWTLVAHNMPALRTGRTYQLWLVTRTAKISAGTFEPSNGDAVVRATYPLAA